MRRAAALTVLVSVRAGALTLALRDSDRRCRRTARRRSPAAGRQPEARPLGRRTLEPGGRHPGGAQRDAERYPAV